MKPSGLSGESEQPSEDQSKEEGFWALRAAWNWAMELLKSRRSVASIAVSRASSCVGAARPREASPITAKMENFMMEVGVCQEGTN